MAFCKNCGQPIADNAEICPSCGVRQKSNITPDDGGILWGLLGCCIPIVGLVLFLVWKDEKPNNAKAAGIGALVFVGLAFAYYLFIGLLGAGMASMFAHML